MDVFDFAKTYLINYEKNIYCIRHQLDNDYFHMGFVSPFKRRL